MAFVRSTRWLANDFTFSVGNSQALLAQTSHNEWVVDFGCTHHMAKDRSLLSSFDNVVERNIFVGYDFALNIADHGDINRQRGQIVDVFHVPSLSANLLSVSQLTQIGKIVEFWPD